MHQALDTLKKMVYKVDPNPNPDIFEIMMDSTFHHGNENMVRQLFEIYSEEFKMTLNPTMIRLMILSKSKENLAKQNYTAITDDRLSSPLK